MGGAMPRAMSRKQAPHTVTSSNQTAVDLRSWPGNPDASTTFPAEMLVDWVRVEVRG